MQTNDQPKRGRPSDYSAEIAEAICDRLVNGESLRAVCADPAMPARATVLLRVHGIEHLADQLASRLLGVYFCPAIAARPDRAAVPSRSSKGSVNRAGFQ
jgi:hypothetical protein